jgi:general secretion pathway protein G
MPRSRRRGRTFRLQTGFTLIEIMVVVMILGLLATMVAHNIAEHSHKARLDKAAVDVKQLADAARLYFAEKGRLPTLAELATADERGRSYIDSVPVDPWQNDYVLREGSRPREVEVLSAGPNRQPGDEDDISSKAAPN